MPGHATGGKPGGTSRESEHQRWGNQPPPSHHPEGNSRSKPLDPGHQILAVQSERAPKDQNKKNERNGVIVTAPRAPRRPPLKKAAWLCVAVQPARC